MARVLLAAGADPNVKSGTGSRHTPLTRLTQHHTTIPKHDGHAETLETLLAAGADPNLCAGAARLGALGLRGGWRRRQHFIDVLLPSTRVDHPLGRHTARRPRGCGASYTMWGPKRKIRLAAPPSNTLRCRACGRNWAATAPCAVQHCCSTPTQMWTRRAHSRRRCKCFGPRHCGWALSAQQHYALAEFSFSNVARTPTRPSLP